MNPNVYSSSYDEDLRSYLLSVFNNMSLALFISGLVSSYVGLNDNLAQAIWGTGLKWIVIFAPLGVSARNVVGNSITK